ncbi:hypothetical protein [Kordiimonas sp. SCSIO 12610]|uniref:hypothetical protein n=1 Tax=Kordiimonas sp. SCSIO 12610 TaxID=2829597 RepID=UPI00210DCEC6|nr:hypothetical protein [Kordiimonas sp. SCSIO 12610]UTW56645.1 hypothetical protein KFF44_07070 [Kordiimonas sp. SCSIO 12610]
MEDVKAFLEQSFKAGDIVRIYRSNIEDGFFDGFVAGIGDEFFALEIFDDACRLDGFSCVRYDDVTEFKLTPYADFNRHFMRLNSIKKNVLPSIDLSSLKSLLITAGCQFPIITIHIDYEDESVCYIGKVESVTDTNIDILYVTPDAEWEDIETYALDEINRVDFGGAYERALLMVANDRMNNSS